MDSYLGEVGLSIFIVIQTLALDDIDTRFLIKNYVGVDEVYQWSENEDGFAVLDKVNKNKLNEGAGEY